MQTLFIYAMSFVKIQDLIGFVYDHMHLRTYAEYIIYYAMSFVKIQDLIGFVYDHMHLSLRTYADLY